MWQTLLNWLTRKRDLASRRLKRDLPRARGTRGLATLP